MDSASSQYRGSSFPIGNYDMLTVWQNENSDKTRYGKGFQLGHVKKQEIIAQVNFNFDEIPSNSQSSGINLLSKVNEGFPRKCFY